MGKKTDAEDMGKKTRGTNKRREDNKAKQWGHQTWEMDGRTQRQRQKKGRRVREAVGLRGKQKKERELKQRQGWEEEGRKKIGGKCGIKCL